MGAEPDAARDGVGPGNTDARAGTPGSLRTMQAHWAQDGRFLTAALAGPWRVLAACHPGGGLREDATHVVNHQSCEGVGHDGRLAVLTAPDYLARACAEAGTPPATTVLLGTAANAALHARETVAAEDLTVCAAVTAGVHGNAARAGDPARWHERDGRWVARDPAAPPAVGTINLILLISRPCTAGCLARALVTAAEAKAGLLMELRIPSRQSRRLATGTGTDQAAIACPQGAHPLTDAGHHTVLGELVGRAVEAALGRALAQQQHLQPITRRSVGAALERWGWSDGDLLAAARAGIPTQAALLERNLPALLHDPHAGLAAHALADTADRIAAGLVPVEQGAAAIADQAALLACAIAGSHERFADHRRALRGETDPAAAARAALLRGFAERWA